MGKNVTKKSLEKKMKTAEILKFHFPLKSQGFLRKK